MKRIIFALLILFLFPLFCQGQVLHGKVTTKKEFNFRGNLIRFSDPVSMVIAGKMRTSNPMVSYINANKIVRAKYETDSDPKLERGETPVDYIKHELTPSISKLPDGNYMINTFNLVVDDHGKLVYFDFTELTPMSSDLKSIHHINGKINDLSELSVITSGHQSNAPSPTIDNDLKKSVESALYKILLHFPKFVPASSKGKNVFCLLDPRDSFNGIFSIKNHKVTFR